MQRQGEQPLFPNILWNRPLNRTGAGRLLIIGGHQGDISQVQAAYQMAQAAGIGMVRVVLPDALARLVGGLPDMVLVPSSPSGSLGRGALGGVMRLAADYDALLLGLNLSNNSESSVLAENLLERLDMPMVVAGDGLEALKFNLRRIAEQPDNLLVTDMRELFKIAGALGVGLRIRPDGGVVGQADIVQSVAEAGKCSYLVYDGHLLAASPAEVSVTELRDETSAMAGAASGLAATFWLQNRSKPFEAITSACWLLGQAITTAEGPALNDLSKAVRRILTKDEF